MSDDWKNNPRLSGMDPQKLSMLQGLADQGLGKNPSELLPFIMGAASKGTAVFCSGIFYFVFLFIFVGI